MLVQFSLVTGLQGVTDVLFQSCENGKCFVLLVLRKFECLLHNHIILSTKLVFFGEIFLLFRKSNYICCTFTINML